MWEIRFTKSGQKDKILLKCAGLEKQARKLIKVLMENPFQNPPSYEKLLGTLKDYYSRRINIKHRIVYRVDSDNKIVIIHSMWTHYQK